jgi:DNA-directed RNA polymerase subunit L
MSFNSEKMIVHNPKIELNSNINDENLLFTLSGVNVSIANSIRRVILSEIPIIVFRVSPNEKNKCVIYSNTCGLTNEIVKHRLSCIPIHIKDINDFDYKNHIMELNIENKSDISMYVTTKDFRIKNIKTDNYLNEDKLREIFPPDNITGDFIDFVLLKPKVSDDLNYKIINLSCEFDIGTAKEDGAYNVVSTCSYGNTIDIEGQDNKLQQLIQKWKDEGKNKDEVDFEIKNWKLLEGKRIFLKDSFDFEIQSIGIYNNSELLLMSCKILTNKLDSLSNLIDNDELEIKNADSTIANSFDIILENEDYTLGKVIEYFLIINYFDSGILSYIGFKKIHPHDNFSILRLAYFQPVELTTIKGHLKICIENAIEVYNKIRKEMLKLYNEN